MIKKNQIKTNIFFVEAFDMFLHKGKATQNQVLMMSNVVGA